ncbi:hypothetical protein H6504_00570 [Candidatus Woesearchaeota archaeon]|nr:hypothetical protein [Candidatus Woesearchaeota archaeon]
MEDEYDRSSTMFTPEGRISQLEYASKTAAQGSPCIGLVCTDGVVVIAHHRKRNRLLADGFSDKVVQIDSHLGMGLSGLLSDGRRIVERLRVVAQRHKLTFDSHVRVKEMLEEVSAMLQNNTQFDGMRPYGVRMLVAGVDSEPRLYLTDINGSFYGYRAASIGDHADELHEKLQDSYKKMTVSEGIGFIVGLYQEVLGDAFSKDLLDGFTITDTYVPVSDF